jgi:hypothetical protein
MSDEVDMGVVIDGEVIVDSDSGRIQILDSEHHYFEVEEHLRKLKGKQIRFTCITLESMENLEKMLAKVQGTN